MSITDDPVLRTYKVGLPEYPVLGEQICYDIGGFFAPVSIRDQIIRSCSVIERAWHYGLISPTRPLLIIGGGHAGVVAAIQAVECGVETTLIDRNDVLSRLARSGRFVSMLQYDWPAAHWRKKTFPWDDSDSIPVVIEDGPVRVSVATLRNEFSVARADFADRFHLHPYTVCSDPIVEADPAGGYPTLKMSFDKVDFDGTVVRSVTPSVTEFGMALSCTGLGAEKVYLPDPHPFRSVEFWALDTFNRVDKGSVIICGSGDGGLQDFLLFATKEKSAKDIYLKLNLPSEKEYLLYRAEDQLRRAEIWWNKDSRDNLAVRSICKLYSDIHDLHEEVVKDLLGGRGFRRRVRRIVRKTALSNLSLAHTCEHFTAYYSLNRFLALLIGRFIERETRRRVFLSNSGIRDVGTLDSSVHRCAGDFAECQKAGHYVIRKEQVRCLGTGITLPDFREEYDFVILRFGLTDPYKAFGATPSLPGLQLLPSSLW